MRMTLQLVCRTNTVTVPLRRAALVDLRLNIVGDFVGPFAISANLELILVNTHRILENNTGPNNSRALIFVPGGGLIRC